MQVGLLIVLTMDASAFSSSSSSDCHAVTETRSYVPVVRKMVNLQHLNHTCQMTCDCSNNKH